ncbi:MAG TPA: type II secretion system protein [Verrucomicrobiae bacterium]|nr:type II secretion system protein [Verrucomicrobiae bacterium]
MLNRFKSGNKEGGFTIIEVLIVLAIAGLIMVVVFLAVPNLQRSQRNNSRKTDANNILSSLSDYVSNNGGALPAAACGGANTVCSFVSSINLGYFTAANVSFATSVPANQPTPTDNQVFIYGDAVCTSAAGTPTATGANSRNIAVYYGIEGSVTTQCISE